MKMTPLIDERVVAQTFALRRQLGKPEPKREARLPLGQTYGSVLRAPDGHWTMWYLNPPHYCEYIATSSDGLIWQCPNLDLVAPDIRPQTTGPNAFLAPGQKDATGRWLVHDKGPEGFCVLDSTLTPHPAARRRYTAMYLARAYIDGRSIKGLHIAHSDDGLHWLADEHNPVIPGWRDTANVLFYDTRIRRYVWYGRPEAIVASGRNANRLIARAESDDLIHWNPERIVLDTDDRDADPLDLVDELAFRGLPEGADAMARARAAAAITETTDTTNADVLIRGRNRQWYGITAFPYSSLYLGLGWMYDIPSGEIWIELLHSYDGLDWRRETGREPFLPHQPGDLLNSMSSPPVEVGDELWIYTATRGNNHHGVPAPDPEPHSTLYTLHRDRWVAYAAGNRPGELLTQPLPRGTRIALNLRAPHGTVRVAVLDAEGRAIEGFTLRDSLPLTGDGLALTPTWSGGRTAANLPADLQTLRLRLLLEHAEVFALET